MQSLNLKTLTTGLAALLLMSGIFANQALAAEKPKEARIVVAKSGGNYTTITAALNAINPTATNRYVIEVWPGVYAETDTIRLKSYVHLKGSGRDVTTLQFGGSLSGNLNVIEVEGKTNVTISGFNITGGNEGIHAISTTTSANSVTIMDNGFSNNNWFGIGGGRPVNGATSTALITNNSFTSLPWTGISLNLTSATITGNSFSGIGQGTVSRSDSAISVTGGSYTIIGNIITDNNAIGVHVSQTNPAIMSDNVIINNALGGVKISYYVGGNFTNNKIVNNGVQTEFPS